MHRGREGKKTRRVKLKGILGFYLAVIESTQNVERIFYNNS